LNRAVKRFFFKIGWYPKRIKNRFYLYKLDIALRSVLPSFSKHMVNDVMRGSAFLDYLRDKKEGDSA